MSDCIQIKMGVWNLHFFKETLGHISQALNFDSWRTGTTQKNAWHFWLCMRGTDSEQHQIQEGGWDFLYLLAERLLCNLFMLSNMNKTFSSVGLDLKLVSCFCFCLAFFFVDWHSHFRVKSALIKQIMHFTCPASPSPLWPSQFWGCSRRGLRNKKVKHVRASIWTIIECIADETAESLLEPDTIKGGIKEAWVFMWPKRVRHATAQTGFALDDWTVQMNIKPD